jgi:steroid delta-isomerase-like uncharacterized protein
MIARTLILAPVITGGEVMATAEENKALVRRYIEAVNTRDPGVLDQFIASDFIDHDPTPFPGLPPGLQGAKQSFELTRIGFPDGYHEIQDLLADGNKVVTRIWGRGTHLGDFLGIPATGKQVTMDGITIFRIEDGKIVERWGRVDALGLLQQMGVIPPLGPPVPH